MYDRFVKEHSVCERRATYEPVVEDAEAGAIAKDERREDCRIELSVKRPEGESYIQERRFQSRLIPE